MTQHVWFTRFTSSEPLAKLIGKGPEGGIVKTASAQMYRGHFETLKIDASAQAIAAALQDFSPTQALSPSLSLGPDSGAVVTQKALSDNPGAVARDKRHFGYLPDVPGVLVLDFDPPKGSEPLTPLQLWQALLQVWPDAASGIVVHWVSGSSLIFDGDRQVTGIGGQRLYVVLAQQASIPQTLQTLNKRARLMGIGAHVKITSRGVRLIGTLFDAAMADAGGRLDFAPAGAVCRDGLSQRRGPPTILADGVPLDPPTPLTAKEEGELAALDEAAKLKAAPEAEAIAAEWLAAKQKTAALKAVEEGKEAEPARERVKRDHQAMLGGVLMPSAELIHVDAEGKEHVIEAGQLLADPKLWHGQKFLSPHEPDHRNRSPDAIAYTLQSRPVLFDLNDHLTYRLVRQPVAVEVVKGSRAATADAIAAELALDADLMNCAGGLVRVVDGAFASVSRPMLGFIVGTRIALHTKSKTGLSPVDADQQTLDMVHALLTERARKVQGRSSIPLITAEGRVIDQPGLDDDTGIYLETVSAEDASSVPNEPTRTQTVEALRRAWHPFSLYDWATPHDRAATLAIVLTVPLRPTIDAAPGLFADASSQGAGKSAIARAIMILVQGHGGGMKSWAHDSDIEIDKLLLSLAKAGASAVGFDNITATFDSAPIATAVIEGRVSARQLGVTQALSPIFRPMWLASGNQASLSRDMGTRFLQARIASVDGHKKSFPFEPSEAAVQDRQSIVRAIVTVHLAWHAAKCPRADDITTRFSVWGRTVRHMVQWLQSSGIAAEAGIGALGDCADSILNREGQSDPDTENSVALLAALHDEFDGAPFAAREVTLILRDAKDSSFTSRRALWEAVSSYFPRALNGPTVQSLSSLLRNRRDRIYAGLQLVMLPKLPGREGERTGQLFKVVEC